MNGCSQRRMLNQRAVRCDDDVSALVQLEMQVQSSVAYKAACARYLELLRPPRSDTTNGLHSLRAYARDLYPLSLDAKWKILSWYFEIQKIQSCVWSLRRIAKNKPKVTRIRDRDECDG